MISGEAQGVFEAAVREALQRDAARVEAEIEAALQRGETPWVEIRPDGTQQVVTERTIAR